MKYIAKLGHLGLAAALSACAAAQTVERPRAPEQPATASEPQPSPASTPVSATRTATCTGLPAETQIRVEETTHGAALVFTTSADIAALRDGVAQRIASLGLPNTHLDNVDSGIRMVFESQSDGHSKVREMVVLRGRELSKTCGLEWDTRNDSPPKEEVAAASPVKPETTPTDDKSKSDTPSGSDPKKEKDEAKDKDKDKDKDKKTDAKAPVTKPADKSKDDKPKDGDKSKPKPPPLPPPQLPPPPPPPPPPGPRPF